MDFRYYGQVLMGRVTVDLSWPNHNNITPKHHPT